MVGYESIFMYYKLYGNHLNGVACLMSIITCFSLVLKKSREAKEKGWFIGWVIFCVVTYLLLIKVLLPYNRDISPWIYTIFSIIQLSAPYFQIRTNFRNKNQMITKADFGRLFLVWLVPILYKELLYCIFFLVGLIKVSSIISLVYFGLGV